LPARLVLARGIGSALMPPLNEGDPHVHADRRSKHFARENTENAKKQNAALDVPGSGIRRRQSGSR
jgi:hypothetical protein